MLDYVSNDLNHDQLPYFGFNIFLEMENGRLFYDDVLTEPVPPLELQPRNWDDFKESLCPEVLETAASYQLATPTISYPAQDEVADASDAPDAPDMDDSDYEPNSPKPTSARAFKSQKGKRTAKNPRPRSVKADLGIVSSARKERSQPMRRNAEANQEERKTIEKMLAILDKDKNKKVTNFTCPVCVFKQCNARLPDFKRHLKTHIAHEMSCTGVLLEDRDDYPIPPDSIPYEIKGVLHIGGCQRSFSRKDALSRHIKNPANSCVGR